MITIRTSALLYRVSHHRLTQLASFSFARGGVKPPTPPPTQPSESKAQPAKKVSKASDFEIFDPAQSKYGLPREEQVRQTV